MLLDLDFRIRTLGVDGEWAAAPWEEMVTIHGDPYTNQGVDVFRVERKQITVLYEGNDLARHREPIGRPPI